MKRLQNIKFIDDDEEKGVDYDWDLILETRLSSFSFSITCVHVTQNKGSFTAFLLFV